MEFKRFLLESDRFHYQMGLLENKNKKKPLFAKLGQ